VAVRQEGGGEWQGRGEDGDEDQPGGDGRGGAQVRDTEQGLYAAERWPRP